MRHTAGVGAIVAVVALMRVGAAQAPATQDAGRDADRAAIRAHIEAICQAFVDGDIAKIHDTHTDDWRGFLEGSRTPIKGIDDYMRANGIPWPLPAGSTPSRGTPNPGSTFNVFDFDVHFYSPDLAVASFFVDFGTRTGGEFKTGTRYRIMDVYARRTGAWIQAASHTVIDPVWKAEQQSKAAALPPPVKDQLLAAREAVWRAYFANDQAQLKKLVPEDAIALEGTQDKPFEKQAEILASAEQFGRSGSKLVRLEFPQTEIQAFGTTAIVYTTYVFEIETPQGQRQTSTGKATEIFVRRNGAWVNPGWHMAAAAK